VADAEHEFVGFEHFGAEFEVAIGGESSGVAVASAHTTKGSSQLPNCERPGRSKETRLPWLLARPL
jgi:hypothetical protein